MPRAIMRNRRSDKLVGLMPEYEGKPPTRDGRQLHSRGWSHNNGDPPSPRIFCTILASWPTPAGSGLSLWYELVPLGPREETRAEVTYLPTP